MTFFYGNPVPPEHFFGRKALLRQLFGLIAGAGESSAVIGDARIGKTSLINYLASPGAQAEITRQSGGRQLLVSHVDTDIVNDDFTRERFWSHVFGPFEDDILASSDAKLANKYKGCREDGFNSSSLEPLMSRLGETNHRLLVLIDEIDVLLGTRVRQYPEFFATLRSLSKKGTLTMVVTSGQRLSTLNTMADDVRKMGSPYFNHMHEFQLGAFEAGEADALLDLAKDHFSIEDRAFLRQFSGDHPYLLQVGAYWLLNGYETGLDAKEARRCAIPEMLRETEGMFERTWHGWSPNERYISAAIGAAHLEAMGVNAGWTEPDASAQRGLLSDVELCHLEIDGLRARGFVTSPELYRIRPLRFLAWLAIKLRIKSQSPRLWSDWIQEEGWEGILSAPRRDAWNRSIRPRAMNIHTDLEALVDANAKLGQREPPPLPPRADRPTGPIKIYCSFASPDENHQARLETALALMVRNQEIEAWSVRDTLVKQDPESYVDRADVIVLLLSSDLLASGDCSGIDLDHVRERHERDGIRVIPIHVRPCDTGDLWFNALQPATHGGKAITQYSNEDEAWAEVTAQIRRAVDDIKKLRRTCSQPRLAATAGIRSRSGEKPP